MITHHMGTGISSPCGLEPASVYRGFEATFTTDWAEVDCPACLTKKSGVEPPTPKMSTFYVTFGVMYSHTPHPYWPGVHPDGYLEVIAPDEGQARALVRTFVGLKFSMMYDRKPEWARRGRLAAVCADGTIWQAEGVEPPTPKFTAQDPQYWGHEADEAICARIEGTLAENSNTDAIMQLGYEAEFVHQRCFQEGVALFREVTDVDYRVLACELDWSEQDQYECAVCQEGIL